MNLFKKQCQHKFGKVTGSYQYCEKCGIAIKAPFVECYHDYEIINIFESKNIRSGNITSIRYISRCSICGDIKEKVVSH